MSPNKIAAGNRHRAFSFDRTMKFEHHHCGQHQAPAAVLSSGVSREHGMNRKRLAILLSCFAILATVWLAYLAYLFWHVDSCAAFFRLAQRLESLESGGARYSLTDGLLGLLHPGGPLGYYKTKLGNQKKELLASGQLAELRISYTGPRSDREIARALLAVSQKTGAAYWFDYDLNNRQMVILCRSRDLPKFSAAVK